MYSGDATNAPAGDSDEVLFDRTCRDDDHAAFGRIVARYRVRMIALVRRMLASSQTSIDPEDVAQEAFLDAYRRRTTFRRGAQFRPWLYGIAVNRCVDKIRAMDREPTLAMLPSDEDADPISATRAIGPLDALMRNQEIRDIDRAIGNLPPKLRAVLVLRYVDDLSYEAISAACAVPLGTVKTHLFRARTELKRRLDDGR
jgi:RNA polymerase sigma-70 factor (ECF subfamily)